MKYLTCLLFVVAVLSAQTVEERVQDMAQSLAGNAASLVSSGVVSNAGCRGGLPHFNIGAAVNMGWFKFQNPATSEDVEFPAFFPYLYSELGLFRGFSVTPAFRELFAVDFICKYAPTLVKADYFQDLPYLFAYGIKIQLLKDQLIPPTPAISVTIMNSMYQGLTFEFEDTLYTKLALDDLSVRAAVSKSLPVVTPYGGISYDTYSMKTDYWTSGDATHKAISDIKKEALSYFVGFEFKVLVLKGYLEGQYRNEKFGLTLGVKAGI
ncbi:MAG: hypothetical protein PHQ71_01105 [Candidatus Hydrothermia bacterium]|nr:hypothetical protein [Candidatus Hydrothermia bacterium]